MRRLVDTHAHLDRADFDADRAELLARARAAGVAAIVLPAIAPDGWDALLALAAAEPGIVPGLGLHPQAVPSLDPAQDEACLARLEALLRAHPKAVVGECGLDGPAAKLHPWGALERQARLLEAQLSLARRLHRPALLHVFRAHGEALRLLEASGPLPAGGVLHSFSGSAELVPRYARLGLHFSFTGPVTFPASTRVHAAACAVPEELLLLESDAPDQPPLERRGLRNEPANLTFVLHALARLRAVDPDALAAATTRNAVRLFGLAALELR